MSDKTAKQVKDEVIIILQSYINGFKDKEKDSAYFDGYRACLKTIKEMVDKIDTGDDPEPIKSPEPIKKESKVRYL